MGALSAAVLADGPTHYWRLNESGGNVFANSSPTSVRPLFAGGALPIGYTGPDSDSGSLFLWNGTFGPSVSLQTANVPNFQASAFTYEIWVYVPDLVISAAMFVMSNHLSTTNHGAAVFIQTNGRPAGEVGKGGANIQALGPNNMSTDAWHAIALTWDLANIRVYMDGVLQVTVAAATPLDVPTAAFLVGGESTAGLPTNLCVCLVSEVAIYAAALSAARLLAHFNAATLAGAQPVYRLPLSGGPGSPVTAAVDLSSVLAAVRKTY